jgi:hypothetical protein
VGRIHTRSLQVRPAAAAAAASATAALADSDTHATPDPDSAADSGSDYSSSSEDEDPDWRPEIEALPKGDFTAKKKNAFIAWASEVEPTSASMFKSKLVERNPKLFYIEWRVWWDRHRDGSWVVSGNRSSSTAAAGGSPPATAPMTVLRSHTIKAKLMQ